jgi:hypothetical protein
MIIVKWKQEVSVIMSKQEVSGEEEGKKNATS